MARAGGMEGTCMAGRHHVETVPGMSTASTPVGPRRHLGRWPPGPRRPDPLRTASSLAAAPFRLAPHIFLTAFIVLDYITCMRLH